MLGALLLGRAENAAIQALTPGVTSRVLSSEKKSQADATYRNKGSVSSESESNLRLEIGHVLFIDLVGYSALLIEEQRERLSQLTEVVLETAQVQVVGGMTQVPTDAVFYREDGSTWVYVRTARLTFERFRIAIARVSGTTTYVTSGLAADSVVATVGVAELRGAEDGIPGEQ